MSAKKTVLITGCTDGGIGAALAKEFHSQGCRVFATSRRLETMSASSAPGIETLALDVTEISAIKKTRDEISTRTGGKLDILVNNAAVADMDMSAVRELFELNFFSSMCMVQEFLPLLSPPETDASAVYNASKAAIHAFGDTLRIELAPFNNIEKPHSFPDNSLYKSMEDIFRKTRVKSDKGNATPTEESAEAHPRGWLWAASSSTPVWFVHTFMPRIVMDWMATRTFGFSEFSPSGQVKDKHV
ncbi:hypothetical protein B0H19DRAFT_1214742 [Mycena capillaripes]|nr:hypothetical protein B0H19DRAFT_1214742 [Mycena capillaripes]